MAEKSPININKLVKNILTLATLALIIFLMWYFMSVTIYIVCGVMLSLFARPLYTLLGKISIGRFKIPGAVNALLSIFLIWGVLGGIGAIIFPIIVKEAVKISKVNPEKFITQLETPINNTVNRLENLGLISFEPEDTVQQETVRTIEGTIVYKLLYDSIYNAVYNKGAFFDRKTDTLIKVSKIMHFPKKDSASPGIGHRKEVVAMIKTFWMNQVSFQKVSKWFGSFFTLLGNILATIASASL